jgi:hypothetical protein
MSVSAAVRVPGNYGHGYRWSIGNRPLSPLTLGRHIKESFPPRNTIFAGKKGGTSGVERFNCTLRQRCSRLVRKTLSFSKKVANHLGAVKYFLCHYNLEAVKT